MPALVDWVETLEDGTRELEAQGTLESKETRQLTAVNKNAIQTFLRSHGAPRLETARP